MTSFIPPTIGELDASPEARARAAATERDRLAAFKAGKAEGDAEGYTRGHQEGLAKGREECAVALEHERNAHARNGAASASAALQHLLQDREATQRALDVEVRACVAAAIHAIIPAVAATAAGREVIALVAARLTDHPGDPIAIRAHPDTLVAMRRDGFPSPGAPIELIGDSSLPLGAALARWATGGLAYDPNDLAYRVGAILGDHNQAPPKELST